MAVTSMSVKGQVVIPKEVRKALGLRPGTKLIVEAEEDRIVLRPAHNQAGTRLYGKFRGADFLADLRKEHRREIARERHFDERAARS